MLFKCTVPQRLGGKNVDAMGAKLEYGTVGAYKKIIIQFTSSLGHRKLMRRGNAVPYLLSAVYFFECQPSYKLNRNECQASISTYFVSYVCLGTISLLRNKISTQLCLLTDRLVLKELSYLTFTFFCLVRSNSLSLSF